MRADPVGLSAAPDHGLRAEGASAAGLPCHDASALWPDEQSEPDAAKAHVLNVIDVQAYDRNAEMAIQAILDITRAVIEPRKMKEEELLETGTISED